MTSIITYLAFAARYILRSEFGFVITKLISLKHRVTSPPNDPRNLNNN